MQAGPLCQQQRPSARFRRKDDLPYTNNRCVKLRCMEGTGASIPENIMRIRVLTFDVLQIILAGAIDFQGCESSQHLRLPLINISLEVIPAAAHHIWPQRVVRPAMRSCYFRISSCVRAETIQQILLLMPLLRSQQSSLTRKGDAVGVSESEVWHISIQRSKCCAVMSEQRPGVQKIIESKIRLSYLMELDHHLLPRAAEINCVA